MEGRAAVVAAVGLASIVHARETVAAVAAAVVPLYLLAVLFQSLTVLKFWRTAVMDTAENPKALLEEVEEGVAE